MYLLSRYIGGGTGVETRIQKWGNSLAVRIPKPFAAEVGLEPNSSVEISLVDGSLVITPVAKPVLSLRDLLAQVNEANLHREVDTGPAVGNEIW
jgi:antitoxin MazE